MKKQNVVSKRRPRQNILSIILSSAKKKKASSASAFTPNTAPTSKSTGSRSSSSTPRPRTKSNKLLSTAVELTRRSKDSRKPRKSILLKGSRAFYRGPKGIEKVTIVGVHHDAKLEPYYTIKFRDGKEKQMDGKCLTPIEEKREDNNLQRRSSVTSSSNAHKGQNYGSSSEQPTDQCSSSSSEPDCDNDGDRFHKGQDAYYRSPCRENVTKIKIVEKISNNTYTVAFSDGSVRHVEGERLAGLIDLTSKELASLMKEKNERSAANQTPNLRPSIQSNELDHGYEPEAEPSSSENSYEDTIQNSPGSNSTTEKQILALPCAVQMVEAKTEEGGTRLVPLYKAEMDVYYRGPQGVISVAHILKSHFDDLLEPYYTIRLEDGREKQTDNAHISLEKPEEITEEGMDGEPVVEGEGEDDWYQEWKESQLMQDQELREEMKQYERENGSLSAEESTEEKQPQAVVSAGKTVSKEEQSEHTKEELSEPDIVVSLQSLKDHGSQRHSERSESRTDSPVETTPRVKKLDPDDCAALVPAPQFHVGDSVLYNSSKGEHMRATITKVRKDEKHRPYFVVKLSNGDEKKVYGHRLTPVKRESDRDSSRTRSRSRSRARRDSNVASSMRSTSMDPKRLSRMASIDSNGSRDTSVDRSRSSSDRRAKLDRSRSMSRPPKEYRQSRGHRAESRDPRGRVHPSESKESRSRSKSVRAVSKESSSREEGSEQRQRARSRSRAPDDSTPRRSTNSGRKTPMVMGVSHRVQHIGDDEGSRTRSSKGSTSRFGKLKSSISSGITKAKQRSFDR
ncbi:hypothetical protein ACHAXN_003511 [Cyclotella atomus]